MLLSISATIYPVLDSLYPTNLYTYFKRRSHILYLLESSVSQPVSPHGTPLLPGAFADNFP